MTLDALIIWLVIGAVAGILADAVVRGIGLSLGEAIIVGIVGAVLGGWIFTALGIGVAGNIVGQILVAFVGAVVLLVLVKAIRRR